MGALAGVSMVAYDCKSATVTMKGAGTLTEEAARAALAKKSFKMSSFREGPQPTTTVYLFRVTGIEPGSRAAVAAHLRENLVDADEVLVDGGAWAIVRMKRGKASSEGAIAKALEVQGARLEGFETRQWPTSLASYSISLSGVDGAAARDEVRTALQGLEKVLAAFVLEEGPTARVFLREPCDRIEEMAREALRAKGIEVAKFGTRL